MRITERYDQIVRDTIRRVTVGEDQVDHEVLMETTVSPRTGRRQPTLIIVLTMSGLNAGDRIGDMIFYDTPYPAIEEIDRAVQELLHSLRKTKLKLVDHLLENALETR